MKKFLAVIAILVAAAACGGAAGSTAGAPSSLSHAPIQSNVSSGGPAKISGQPDGTTTPTNPSGTTTVPVLQGPPVIRQAQLTLTVGSGSFDSKLTEIRTLVEAQGGYIAGTDAQLQPTDTQIRTGVLNFMVPAGNFDTTIDQLSKVGKIQHEHIAGTDVSGQYVDLRTRLANAEAQRAAMLTILSGAKTIPDMLQVQQQIGQITGEIESLKGQIKYLDDNTSYSQVSVTLAESGAPAQPAATDSWGFSTALSEAAHNFVTTINYVVTALGAVGPILVLAGLGYLLWRRRGSPLPRRA
jgi:hypothetical protein